MDTVAQARMRGQPVRMRGQGEEFDRILRGATSLRLPHGLLLTGPRGSGKTTAARQIAAALLCPASRTPVHENPTLESPRAESPRTEGTDSCGTCRTCRAVHAASHPDLHCVSLPEERRDIPVELVRELSESLAKLPMEGRARVVVVDPADRLNEQGQNALLKTLEEPGADTFLILATSRPEELLETVRSRLVRLRLRGLGPEEIREFLPTENGGSGAEEVLHLARGSAGMARRFLDPDARVIHGLVVGFLDGTNPLGPVGLAQECLAGAEGRGQTLERARLTLDLLGAEARSRMVALASVVVDPYPARAFDEWTASLELLFDAAASLDLQIPPEQVLASLLLAWPREGTPS